jgi:hypothetical protein
MARNLAESGVQPSQCKFRMLAIGPIYPEQKEFNKHKLLRDKMATLESEVAACIRSNGGEVIGIHYKNAEPEPVVLGSVLQSVRKFLIDNGC